MSPAGYVLLTIIIALFAFMMGVATDSSKEDAFIETATGLLIITVVIALTRFFVLL